MVQNPFARARVLSNGATAPHLWRFAAAMLDNGRLTALWARIEDKEEWDVLRRALKAEAEQRGLSAPGQVIEFL